jgi:Mn2+/Fe2+ NRAMP family transporter
MKNVVKIALGILTSIGGFLDVGAIATSAEAGAVFGPRLLWVLAFSTLCIVFLVEMAGRLAAVSKHTLADALRERYGFRFFIIPYVSEMVVDLLVLGAEIGGVCLALQFITGIPFRWFAIPVALLVWLFIWLGSFALVEDATAILGLVTLAFVVGAIRMKPDLHAVAAGFIPSLPPHDAAHYWYIVLSIIGAIISPYLIYFYSSGAVEDGWSVKDLQVNRAVATIGMGFGSIVAMGVMVVAAMTLLPAGIALDRYEQVPLMLSRSLGLAGFYLLAASLGIACFGACVEVALALAYLTAQTFGWNWGENLAPRRNARFATIYTGAILIAACITLVAADPLKLTLFSMALTVVILPLLLLPMIMLMNDKKFLKEHRNGWISNTMGVVIVLTALILSVLAIPLQLIGG